MCRCLPIGRGKCFCLVRLRVVLNVLHRQRGTRTRFYRCMGVVGWIERDQATRERWIRRLSGFFSTAVLECVFGFSPADDAGAVQRNHAGHYAADARRSGVVLALSTHAR